jgi:crossover junction endodeoxyribonuclease RuvC
MNPGFDRIILGIDPGTNNMGIGLIGINGSKAGIIAMDVLRIDKLGDQPLKLKKIFETVLRNIDEFHPDELAIESQFFGKNVQSMLKLGRAQGVAIAAALYRDIPIFEYSPRKIKMAITGKGSASKEQVAAMLQRMLNITELPDNFDATDALAVAMCHYHQRIPDSVTQGKSYTGWKAFVADNPGRVKGRTSR